MIRTLSAEIRRIIEGIAVPDDLAAGITRALARPVDRKRLETTHLSRGCKARCVRSRQDHGLIAAVSECLDSRFPLGQQGQEPVHARLTQSPFQRSQRCQAHALAAPVVGVTTKFVALGNPAS